MPLNTIKDETSSFQANSLNIPINKSDAQSPGVRQRHPIASINIVDGIEFHDTVTTDGEHHEY